MKFLADIFNLLAQTPILLVLWGIVITALVIYAIYIGQKHG